MNDLEEGLIIFEENELKVLFRNESAINIIRNAGSYINYSSILSERIDDNNVMIDMDI